MYKVFINDKPLYLTSRKNFLQVAEKNFLKLDFKSEKEIHTAMDMLFFSNNFSGGVVFFENENLLWEKFCEQFKVIEAAGGIVFNEKKELLMIYRFEKWDLPKGKIEKDESPKEAALREVCEETGVCDCHVKKELESIYHTYFHKEKQILKKTFWFEMKCSFFSDFKLQNEEGITAAKWMNKMQLKEAVNKTYPSISELISPYL